METAIFWIWGSEFRGIGLGLHFTRVLCIASLLSERVYHIYMYEGGIFRMP